MQPVQPLQPLQPMHPLHPLQPMQPLQPVHVDICVPAVSSAYAAGTIVAVDSVVNNAAMANVDFFMAIILVNFKKRKFSKTS